MKNEKLRKLISLVVIVLFIALYLYLRPSVDEEMSDSHFVSEQTLPETSAENVAGKEAPEKENSAEGIVGKEDVEKEDSAENTAEKEISIDDAAGSEKAENEKSAEETPAEEKPLSEKSLNEKSAKEAENYTEYTFRSKKLLQEHYKKHGIEMGFQSSQDYVDAANQVINNPASLHKLEAEDGDDVYYLEETNEFVIVSTDGYIRTYFYPSAGISFYNRQ